MIARMPGDDWCKFANLRLLYGYMWGHPGKKLLFMGSEFGQWNEWNHDSSLDWHLLEHPLHSGLRRWVRDLNTFYRGQPSLYEVDFESAGFEWVDCSDWERSVISFLRRAKNPADVTLFICNFTPVPRHRLSRRRARKRRMERSPEQRCSTLRRQRPGKQWLCGSGSPAVAWEALLAQPHDSASWRPGSQTGGPGLALTRRSRNRKDAMSMTSCRAKKTETRR